MCKFFSAMYDGKKLYCFDYNQRKNGIKMPDGNQIKSYDSHTSIAYFYGLNEDACKKAEYNPFSDTLDIDKPYTQQDKDAIREEIRKIDFHPMCGDIEGFRMFIEELQDIPWMKPDGTLDHADGIKMFDTAYAARADAQAAARYDARYDALDAARDAALDAAREAARSAAWHSAQDAARASARYDALEAAWEAAGDSTNYAFVKYVCAGLPIDKKHVDYIERRMNVWRHGYGVACDIDGVLYCYRRIG